MEEQLGSELRQALSQRAPELEDGTLKPQGLDGSFRKLGVPSKGSFKGSLEGSIRVL